MTLRNSQFEIVYKRLHERAGVISGITIVHVQITRQSDTVHSLSCYCHNLCGIYAVVAHSRSVIRVSSHYDLHGIMAGHERGAGTCVKLQTAPQSARITSQPCESLSFRCVCDVRRAVPNGDEIGRRHTGGARNRSDCGICGSTHRILLLTAGAIRLRAS